VEDSALSTLPAAPAEKRFRGIAAAAGLARAEALVHWLEEEEVPFRKIRSDELPSEIARFESALIATRAELLEIQQRIADSIGGADPGIFDAHLLVVEDQTLIDEVLRSLEKNLLNIETTFHRVAEKYCKTLQAIDDPYLRERVIDIEDVTRRILRHLLGGDHRQLSTHDQPHIIIAPTLTPSDTAIMNRSMVLGFATEGGSKTSHTAIMARALSIPAIVGLGEAVREINTGDDLLIDGYSDLLILHPSAQTLAYYDKVELEKEKVEEGLELIRDTQSTTSDGQRIVLSANVELPEEMEDVADCGAEGVGLYRTEFLFLNRSAPPDEEEQYQNYRSIVEKCRPHGVIIRTLDIGGDKVSESLTLPDEENPFLGCRAIRFCLRHPEVFRPQLRALLRAATHGDLKILLPMVSGLDEINATKQLLQECREELLAEGFPAAPKVDLGVMIEIPSAALAARHLAPAVDFFSIGTNDLIQYTLAVDRVNEHVAHLYQPTHPAILDLIRLTVQASRQAGIWTGVCGEMAGEIVYTPLLVGLGITELSASPSLVPRVKKAVQSITASDCQNLLTAIEPLSDPKAIHQLCLDLAREKFPDLL
jgi:phosphoenolpyruvate-protein phosphotransferase (PTS system enzyme I)